MELYKGKRLWIMDDTGDLFEATIVFTGLPLTKPKTPHFTIQVYPNPERHTYKRKHSPKYSSLVEGVVVEDIED